MHSLIIAISLGIGLIPLGSPTFYSHFPDWSQIILNSGITAGSVTAILLNGGGSRDVVVACGPPEVETTEDMPSQFSLDTD